MNAFQLKGRELLSKAISNASSRWGDRPFEELRRVNAQAKDEYTVWMDLVDKVHDEQSLEHFKDALRAWWRKLKQEFERRAAA